MVSLCLFVTGADARVVIIGDSIGEGVAMASHQTSFAEKSVQILSAKAMGQLERAPAGSVAVVVLGTNDAVGNLRGVDDAIDRFLAVALDKKMKLVWVGPPCVTKKWNKSVVALDAMLSARLAGKGIYVSIADASWCGNNRAGDGVHFTMAGYQMIWSRVLDADPVDLASLQPANSVNAVTQAPQSDAKNPQSAKMAGTSGSTLDQGPSSLLPNGKSLSNQSKGEAPAAGLGQIAPAAGQIPWAARPLDQKGPLMLPEPISLPASEVGQSTPDQKMPDQKVPVVAESADIKPLVLPRPRPTIP